MPFAVISPSPLVRINGFPWYLYTIYKESYSYLCINLFDSRYLQPFETSEEHRSKSFIDRALARSGFGRLSRKKFFKSPPASNSRTMNLQIICEMWDIFARKTLNARILKRHYLRSSQIFRSLSSFIRTSIKTLNLNGVSTIASTHSLKNECQVFQSISKIFFC